LLHAGRQPILAAGVSQIQIERIRYLCEKCPLLEFDCGQTDEGDPWFVVYDREREQVVLYYTSRGLSAGT
jgi:hypothetical protein